MNALTLLNARALEILVFRMNEKNIVNWKKIIIYSLLMLVLGAAFGFMLAMFGFDSPESYASKWTWFVVYNLPGFVIKTVLFFFLSNSLTKSYYAHAVSVLLTSLFLSYGITYLLFSYIYLSVLDLFGLLSGIVAIYVGFSLSKMINKEKKS